MVAEGKPAVVNTTKQSLLPSYSRTVLPLLAAVALILIAILFLGHEIERHVEAIESWMAHLGYWGVLAFVGFFVMGTSLFMPDTILCIIAGALFGLTRGFGAVIVGSLLASALQYGLARFLLRTRIERRLATRRLFGAIQRAVMQDEIRLQVLLRLTPLKIKRGCLRDTDRWEAVLPADRMDRLRGGARSCKSPRASPGSSNVRRNAAVL